MTASESKGSRGFSPVLHRVKSIENLNAAEKKAAEEDRKHVNYHLVNMFRAKTKKSRSIFNATRIHNLSLKHTEPEARPPSEQPRQPPGEKPDIRRLEGSIQGKLIDKRHRLGPSADSSASTQQLSSHYSHARSRSTPALGLGQVLAELKTLTQKYTPLGEPRYKGKNE